ncbi:MAG: leucyl aminopeptidase [Chloroflexota bacterium]
MKVEVKVASVTEHVTPLLVINLFENVAEPTGATGAIDRALGGFIAGLIGRKEITGKLNEVTIFHTMGKLPAERVAVIGLGKKEEFTLERARQAAGSVARRVQQLKIERFATIAHGGQAGLSPAEAGQAVVEGSQLATYRYLRYKTEDADSRPSIQEMTIVEQDQAKVQELERGVTRGRVLAEATIFSRDLANGPGNLVTPSYLAEQAQEMAARHGLECQILGPEEMRRLGMGALLGVAQGSAQEPRLIVLRYNGGGEGAKTLGFVGKGITFDSGGISIKPGDKMDEMKFDMSGAAAVIGAMSAIAQLKPAVNVLAVAPATENLPSGTAYKPGDILTAMNGKTIEVLNTDAEGRIVLADAVAYAAQQGADLLIDLATLTGACVVALGYHATGAIGNNDQLVAGLIAAGQRTGERVWQLPAWDEYRDQIKSDIADVKNTGGRPGGAITGALFLERFIDGKPWVHLDIAGTAWVESDKPYAPKGAAGWGVRLLTEFAESWATQPLL